MAEVDVEIGGRTFTVSCANGEEEYLITAASMLNEEAETLVGQIGRMPVERMLLMAGLMLADRTAAFEEKAAASQEKLLIQNKLIKELRKMGTPAAEPALSPSIPADVIDSFALLATKAERVAAATEEKLQN